MRIIAGTARGRRIFSVSKNLPVKPISDRIKQSVFDILRPRLAGAMWLDLFAGTGNVSLEALSRGALRVVCVDREPACIKNIHRNLIHLGFEDRARVIKGDVLKPWTTCFLTATTRAMILFSWGRRTATRIIKCWPCPNRR